tara:strand:+ start:353 stop:469 length:117 start_codon:yes stop_codon:yes gene_type:complete
MGNIITNFNQLTYSINVFTGFLLAVLFLLIILGTEEEE